MKLERQRDNQSCILVWVIENNFHMPVGIETVTKRRHAVGQIRAGQLILMSAVLTTFDHMAISRAILRASD